MSYKRGDSWYIDIIINGHRINRKAGKSKKEAREIEEQLRVGARMKSFGLQAPYPLKIFHEAMTEYLDYQKATKSPRTHEGDKWYYEHHLMAFWSTRPLSMADAATLLEFQEQKKRAGLGNRSVNICVTLVRKCLNYAHKKGWCAKPDFKFPKLTEPKRLHAFLSPKEYNHLLDGFTDHGRLAYYRTIFGRCTGLRPSELTYLAWSDIKLDLKVLRVTSKPKEGWTIKTYQERDVPLSDSAMEVLKAVAELKRIRKKKSPWVFSMGARPTRDIKRALKTASENAGLGRIVTANMLRHTFATHAIMAGGNIMAIKEIMGHSELRTTERYLHSLPGDRMKTVQRIMDLDPEQKGEND